MYEQFKQLKKYPSSMSDFREGYLSIDSSTWESTTCIIFKGLYGELEATEPKSDVEAVTLKFHVTPTWLKNNLENI